MSVGLLNSTIERFRVRTHGDASLKLYSLRPDGETLQLLAVLTQGFYIAPTRTPMYGAAPHNAVIDADYSAGLTEAMILKTAFMDLVGANTRRYRVIKDNPPETAGTRYVIELSPAFNDIKAVV